MYNPEYAVIFQNQLNNPFCALFIIKALQGESIKYSPSIFLYRFKKRIRMSRIKDLITGHDSYQIICL